MELNASTFALEVLNFLILVWLLRHFLYRPVTAMIERRRLGIEATLQNAEELHREAEATKARYDERLSAWEAEKRKAMEDLQREIAAERTRLLDELHAELEREREKAAVLEQRHLEELARKTGAEAIRQGTRFAARLLTDLAGPEQQARLLDLFIARLGDLDDDRRQSLRDAFAGDGPPVRVVSAYPLDDAARERITAALGKVTGTTVAAQFSEDPILTAGLRVHAGPLVLRANVRDELEFFGEAAFAAT